MKLDRSEILRYMKMGRAEPDAVLTARIDRLEHEVLAAARPVSQRLRTAVRLARRAGQPQLRTAVRLARGAGQRLGDAAGEDAPRYEVCEDAPQYEIGPLTLASRDLWRCLRGAREAYLFAATLGHDVDRLIRKYAALSAADLLIVQAIAATAIEQYIDDETASWGEKLLPRYSPGYGDLPLSVQPDFLAALDARKTLGITLTETFLMIPSKSVTAIIGIQP